MGSLVEEEHEDNEAGLEGGLQGVKEARPEVAVSSSVAADVILFVFLSYVQVLRCNVRSRFERRGGA